MVLSTEGTASSLRLRSLAPEGVVGWEVLDAAVPLLGYKIWGVTKGGLGHLRWENSGGLEETGSSRRSGGVRPQQGLDSLTEETFSGLPLIARHTKFLTTLQHYDVAALKPRLYLADALDVDDGGAVNSDEVARIKFLGEGLHCFTDIVSAAGDMKPNVVSFGADPVDVGDRDENDASIDEDGQALEVIGLGAGALEQGEEPLGCLLILATERPIADAFEGAGEAVRSKGFEEVITAFTSKAVSA